MNKQIDVMAQTTVGCKRKSCRDCSHLPNCTTHYAAETLYAKGYRKAQDVAREIFAEIEKRVVFNEYGVAVLSQYIFAELKKKYESEGADDD